MSWVDTVMSIKIPKNQKRAVNYFENDILKYMATKDITTKKYILYQVNQEGGIEKLKTSATLNFKEVGYQ